MKEYRVLFGTYDEIREWFESSSIKPKNSVMTNKYFRDMDYFERTVSPDDIGKVKILSCIDLSKNDEDQPVVKLIAQRVCVVEK